MVVIGGDQDDTLTKVMDSSLETNNHSSSSSQVNEYIDLCLVHVIWTERRMSKLVLNVKYLLLLSFLTAAEFYNLGHIQSIIRVQ